MNKENKIIIGIGVVIIVLLAVMVFKIDTTNKTQKLGNLNVNENAYSQAATYSTSSISTNTATSLLVRATSSRTFVNVCNLSNNTVYLYKQATSTGVALGMGYPLFATSTGNQGCKSYDEIDPYLGQIWGIADATATVSVEYLQN